MMSGKRKTIQLWKKYKREKG